MVKLIGPPFPSLLGLIQEGQAPPLARVSSVPRRPEAKAAVMHSRV